MTGAAKSIVATTRQTTGSDLIDVPSNACRSRLSQHAESSSTLEPPSPLLDPPDEKRPTPAGVQRLTALMLHPPRQTVKHLISGKSYAPAFDPAAEGHSSRVSTCCICQNRGNRPRYRRDARDPAAAAEFQGREAGSGRTTRRQLTCPLDAVEWCFVYGASTEEAGSVRVLGVRVREVKPLHGFKAVVSFDDGTQREIDLAPYLHGLVFEPIRNEPAVFRSMEIAGGHNRLAERRRHRPGRSLLWTETGVDAGNGTRSVATLVGGTEEHYRQSVAGVPHFDTLYCAATL